MDNSTAGVWPKYSTAAGTERADAVAGAVAAVVDALGRPHIDALARALSAALVE